MVPEVARSAEVEDVTRDLGPSTYRLETPGDCRVGSSTVIVEDEVLAKSDVRDPEAAVEEGAALRWSCVGEGRDDRGDRHGHRGYH